MAHDPTHAPEDPPALELLRAIVDGSDDAVVVRDREGRYLFCNPAAAGFLGRPVGDVLGRTDAELVGAERAAAWRELDRRVLETGVAATLHESIEVDGELRTYTITAHPYRDAAGRARGVVATACDVTERARREEQLRASERRLADAQRVAGVGSWDLDVARGRLVLSEEAARVLGFAPGTTETTLEALPARVHPGDRARFGEVVSAALRGDEPYELEYRVDDDGGVRHVHGRGSVTRDASGRQHAFGTVQDVTERHRVEAALRQSERRLRDVLDALPIGVAVVDRAGDVLLHNRASVAIWGGAIQSGAERWARSRAWWHRTGRPLAPDEWASVRALTEGQTVLDDLVDIESFDGVRRTIRNSSVPLRGPDGSVEGAVVTNEDVTERLLLEERFHQAQKMEAVGRLAGGVAHDFNNLLTVISSYVDLLLDDTEASDPRRADLQEIATATRSAATLTRQLLAFGRREIVHPRRVLLEQVVATACSMLTRLIGEDVTVRTELGEPPSTICIDPGHLEQLVMNLAVNARDAMPDGGELLIATRRVQLEAGAADALGLEAGPHAVLTVRDTGVGMDELTRSRIFEPFFTTKPRDKGTGLGLSTVYGIVSRGGGAITVVTAPREGTTFEIHFPLADEPASSGARRAPPFAAPRGTETILLVEDSPAVRAVVRAILERQGYDVRDASDGPSALEYAARCTDPIHLMLTDLVMPGMNGRELASEMTTLRPETKVLFMSGYADEETLGPIATGTAFLGKPFSADALARKVRAVLDER